MYVRTYAGSYSSNKKMLAYFLTKWDVNKSIPDAQKVGGDNREIKGVRDE